MLCFHGVVYKNSENTHVESTCYNNNNSPFMVLIFSIPCTRHLFLWPCLYDIPVV